MIESMAQGEMLAGAASWAGQALLYTLKMFVVLESGGKRTLQGKVVLRGQLCGIVCEGEMSLSSPN